MNINKLLFILILLPLMSAKATAVTVRMTLNGEIDLVSPDGPDRSVNIGDTWTLSLYYDLSTPRVEDGFLYSFTSASQVSLTAGVIDREGVGFEAILDAGPNNPPQGIRFILFGQEGDIMSQIRISTATGIIVHEDQHLPASEEDWNLMAYEAFRIEAHTGSQEPFVYFTSNTLNSVTFEIIPEPSTLIVLSGAGLCFRRRRPRV